MKLIFGDGRALAAFAAPAEARPEIWRVVLSLVVVLLTLLGASMLVGLVLARWFPEENPLASLDALATSEGVLFALATFIIWWPGLEVGMRLLHRRGILSLFPAAQTQPVRLFMLGFAIALTFGALGVATGVATSPVERSSLTLASWAAFLPFALILLLVQTGAEEVVFRGYLLQQMAARFRGAWWAWALIPSLLFGALHFSPIAPGGALVAISVTAFGGFALAIVTARTGGIAAAWGLHMGINTMALLIIGPPDYLSGLALWHWDGNAAEITRLAWLDFLWIALIGIGAILWFRPSRQGG